MYKVLKDFVDMKDKNHRYHTGDVFPRSGSKVSAKRLEELSSDKNRRGEPVIEEIPEENEEIEEKPAPTKRGGRKKANAE